MPRSFSQKDERSSQRLLFLPSSTPQDRHSFNVGGRTHWTRDWGLNKNRPGRSSDRTEKCTFGRAKLHLIGRIVSANEISVDTDKVKVVLQELLPQTKTGLRSSLGLASYYRRFIKGFVKIAAPCSPNYAQNRFFLVRWNAFLLQQADERFVGTPVLTYYDFWKAFIVETDASSFAACAIIGQKNDDRKVRPCSTLAARWVLPRGGKQYLRQKHWQPSFLWECSCTIYYHLRVVS